MKGRDEVKKERKNTLSTKWDKNAQYASNLITSIKNQKEKQKSLIS